jgi:hypothetical protein
MKEEKQKRRLQEQSTTNTTGDELKARKERERENT